MPHKQKKRLPGVCRGAGEGGQRGGWGSDGNIIVTMSTVSNPRMPHSTWQNCELSQRHASLGKVGYAVCWVWQMQASMMLQQATHVWWVRQDARGGKPRGGGEGGGAPGTAPAGFVHWPASHSCCRSCLHRGQGCVASQTSRTHSLTPSAKQ